MNELLQINVGDHTEQKNGLTYLSWAWAWTEVLKIDPQATWEPTIFMHDQYTPLPYMSLPDGSCMVQVSVTIKGHNKSCMLPVMNHRNQAIKNPDAFAVNTAIMRCMTKAVSMHGLGLYIYAGEDLPETDDQRPEVKPEPKPQPKPEPKQEKPPAKVEGKKGQWQISVKSDESVETGDWLALVKQATELTLGIAKSQADVMEIFKVNRALFDTVKPLSEEFHTELMGVFKQKKDSFK